MRSGCGPLGRVDQHTYSSVDIALVCRPVRHRDAHESHPVPGRPTEIDRTVFLHEFDYPVVEGIVISLGIQPTNQNLVERHLVLDLGETGLGDLRGEEPVHGTGGVDEFLHSGSAERLQRGVDRKTAAAT